MNRCVSSAFLFDIFFLSYTLPHLNNKTCDFGEHGLEIPDYGIYAHKEWPEAEKGRAAVISRLKRDVGLIMDKLKALGIEKNTLVMFSSDNGPHREGE
jgi:arylsulfatase A-like enzyme